jgi:glycine betaine/proline transport system substrate-binding protein
LKFTLAMENEIMGAILNDSEEPEVAAKARLKANSGILKSWLSGVTTMDGGDSMAAVNKALGM